MNRAIPVAAVAGAAIIFGSTFTVVKTAVGTLPAPAFVTWRFLIAAIVLMAIRRPSSSMVWRDGTIAGVFLFVGFATQTQGLLTTTASKSALITGLYVVLVPLLVGVATRTRPHVATLAGALMGVVGLALLTGTNLTELTSGGVVTGDWLTLISAGAFAAHIVALSYTARNHHLIEFTAIQMFWVTALSALLALATSGLPLPTTTELPAILMTGLAASIGAFLLQIWGQTHMPAARAGIILSVEPVVGAMLGTWILGERFNRNGWIGAAIIVGSIYLVMWATTDDVVALETVSPTS